MAKFQEEDGMYGDWELCVRRVLKSEFSGPGVTIDDLNAANLLGQFRSVEVRAAWETNAHWKVEDWQKLLPWEVLLRPPLRHMGSYDGNGSVDTFETDDCFYIVTACWS